MPEQTVTQEPVELKPGVPPPPVTPAPVKLNDDLRIVITRRKGDVMIGLQRAETDPQFYQVKDLDAAVKGIPAFLSMADKVWSVNPYNPKAPEPPKPPPEIRPAAEVRAAAPSTAKPVSKPAAAGTPKNDQFSMI